MRPLHYKLKVYIEWYEEGVNHYQASIASYPRSMYNSQNSCTSPGLGLS